MAHVTERGRSGEAEPTRPKGRAGEDVDGRRWWLWLGRQQRLLFLPSVAEVAWPVPPGASSAQDLSLRCGHQARWGALVTWNTEDVPSRCHPAEGGSSLSVTMQGLWESRQVATCWLEAAPGSCS